MKLTNEFVTAQCPHCACFFVVQTQQNYIDFNSHRKFCVERKQERDYENEEATLS